MVQGFRMAVLYKGLSLSPGKCLGANDPYVDMLFNLLKVGSDK